MTSPVFGGDPRHSINISRHSEKHLHKIFRIKKIFSLRRIFSLLYLLLKNVLDA